MLRSKAARFQRAAEAGAEAAAEVIRTELQDRTLSGVVVRSVSGDLRRSWRIRTGMNGHHGELFSRARHAQSIHYGSRRMVQATRNGTTFSMRRNVTRTEFLTKAIDASQRRARRAAFDTLIRELR